VSATAEAVEFARDLSLDRVSPRARSAARDAILDALACALAARHERAVRSVREWVRDEGSRGRCGVWGSTLRASPSRAALANGTSAHALDFDDVCWAMNGHPTVPLLPAVLAVAEARGASGADALAAYVAGFEVQARLGQALGIAHYERGWHPTATLGGIGATIAAGRLLGLDAPALRRALGIACSTAAGSRMNFGTDTKPLHAGLAAQSGVVAAELAARGVTAREDGLEADMGLADLYDGACPLALPSFAEPLALEKPGIELKPYPSCRFTHRLVDGVLALRERHPGERALRFELRLQPFAHKILIYPAPTSGLEAKFSAPYCAAVAWLDGWPRLESFSDERAARADVQSLLRAVEVGDASGSDEEEIAVVLASGARDAERVRLPRGHPERPLSEAERLRKVRDCAGPALGARRAEELIRVVGRLERLRDVRELTALLAPAGGDA
jgi:2-methylcitrate dehydratase PrpD